MPRTYSPQYKSTLAAVNADEPPLVMLEIDHPDLSEPVRVINDNQDLTSNGHLFVACPFRCTLPDDFENQLPKATLAVDNIGRELVYWIETSNGGEGAAVRFMQVMRSRPDLIEWEITMSLTDVRVTMLEVAGQVGFENLFNRPAVHLTYRPDNSPGLF